MIFNNKKNKKINHFVIDESDAFFEEKEKRTKKYKYFVDYVMSEKPEYQGTEFTFDDPPKKKKIVRLIEEKYKKIKNSLF